MHLSQYALSTAVLSTGVNAFYPYLRTSLDSALDRRFYPYQLGASIDDDTAGLPTLPLKKRSTPRRRENHYTVIEGNPPSTPNSVAVNDDGQDFSYFFAMEFGSKNQSMWMLFDTGGTNTWAFSNNCTVQACEMHNTFGSNDSTTLQVTTDPFDVGYGTGTVTGVLGADVVSFADFSMNLTFGLVSNASSDFEDYPMDGILGLGRSNSSTTGTLTAMETIAESHSLQSNIIGISLQRSSDGAKDGEITFGGVDDTKFTGNITYTDTSPGTTLWQIPLDDAVVNGEPLNFTGKSAIVDTGTSYIFLPPSDAAAIHTLIPGSAASGENFKIPCSSNVTVEFTISGISYSISAKDYVGSGADSTGTTCYSNIIGVQTAGTDNWLLGDVFLKNVYTVFDFDQNRVGFAARNGTVATTTTASAAASTDATSAAATSAGSPTGTSAATSQSPVQTGSAASFAHPKAALLAGAMSLYTLIYV